MQMIHRTPQAARQLADVLDASHPGYAAAAEALKEQAASVEASPLASAYAYVDLPSGLRVRIHKASAPQQVEPALPVLHRTPAQAREMAGSIAQATEAEVPNVGRAVVELMDAADAVESSDLPDAHVYVRVRYTSGEGFRVRVSRNAEAGE